MTGRAVRPGSTDDVEDFMVLDVKPKTVSFDMSGTLIRFRINDAIRGVLAIGFRPRTSTHRSRW